jgi:hypothetical protein
MLEMMIKKIDYMRLENIQLRFISIVSEIWKGKIINRDLFFVKPIHLPPFSPYLNYFTSPLSIQ